MQTGQFGPSQPLLSKSARLIQATWIPRTLTLVEALTVTVLLTMALAYARPVLEGWAVLSEFRTSGISGYLKFLSSNPTRLLEPFPLAISSLFQNVAFGTGSVYGFIIALKYFSARWAVSVGTTGYCRWMLAVLAVVMPPWSSEWRAHNMAQQLSSVFFIIGFGAALRLVQSPNRRAAIILFASVESSLLSYEGLVVCALTLPMFCLLSRRTNRFSRKTISARISLPVIAALILYLCLFVCLRLAVEGTYQSNLASIDSPLRHPAFLTSTIYYTAYFIRPATAFALVMLFGSFVSLGTRSSNDGVSGLYRPMGVILLFVALPFLALPYALNLYFLSDIERVGFAVGMGVFMLASCTVIASRPILNPINCAVISVSTLAFCFVNAYECYRDYTVQRAVLRQTIRIVLADKALHPVLLRDWTGTLGDMYTFLATIVFQQALNVRGLTADVSLCTPKGIDRHLIRTWEVGGGVMVPRCEDVEPIAVDRLLLDARVRDPGNPFGPPIVSAAGIQLPTSFGKYPAKVVNGSSAGREGNFWWLNEPESIISLKNSTREAVSLAWVATLTPPPCSRPASVERVIDGKRTLITVTGNTLLRMIVNLRPLEEKLVKLNVKSGVCKPGLDTRAYYLGILDMSLRLI